MDEVDFCYERLRHDTPVEQLIERRELRQDGPSETVKPKNRPKEVRTTFKCEAFTCGVSVVHVESMQGETIAVRGVGSNNPNAVQCVLRDQLEN